MFSDVLGMSLANNLGNLGNQKVLLSVSWWWVRLDLGVKVFFAISGFVLALPFLKFYLGLSQKRVELKAYFKRRLTRLEPPFIISLVFFYLVHVFLLDENVWVFFKHLCAGLIYSHTFFYGTGNPINPVTWSLEIEAQFYVIVPLVMWLIFIRPNSWLNALVITVFVVISILFRNEFAFSAYLGRTIGSFFVNFAVGILIAWLYLRFPLWIKERTFRYDALGIIATISLFYFYKPQHEICNQIFFNLSIALVMITAFKGRLFNWFYTRPIIYIIGGMCYSIYLIHYAFLHLSVQFTKYLMVESWSNLQNLLVQLILNFFLVLIVSSAFFVFVEKPTMDKDWPKKLLQYFKQL